MEIAIDIEVLGNPNYCILLWEKFTSWSEVAFNLWEFYGKNRGVR